MANFVVISGNVGDAPSYFKDGAVGKISVAIREPGKDGAWNTHWIEVVCWGYTVRHLEGIQKGDKVLVIGKLAENSYTTREGRKATKVNVVATSIEKSVRLGKQSKSELDAAEPEAEAPEGSGLPWGE